MLEVKDIVNVVISREQTSQTVRDLQTIAILSRHPHFANSDVYREYGGTEEMLEDGFLTTDFAYKSASLIFAQNPKVRTIKVGAIKSVAPTPIDYVAEIRTLQSATEEWFFLITDATDDADKLAIAKYIETQTAMYVLRDSNATTLLQATTTDIFSKIKALGLMRTIGIYIKDASVVSPESAWVGRFATATIGSNLWVHKALTGLSPEGFSRTEMAVLKAKNSHFYTKVGQDPSVEGSANVIGGERIHVILGVIWLEVRIGERYWNLLYTKDRILYTNGGIDLFKAELVTVLNEAVDNNILTSDDGFQISTPDANKLTSQVRATGVLSAIKFRARLAGAIIYVNAVEGVVYP
ncbi:MAG: DUF3383 family protein [Bacilli bacterium]